jgi:hypothetical protein
MLYSKSKEGSRKFGVSRSGRSSKTSRPGEAIRIEYDHSRALHVDAHGIVVAKRLATVGALPRAVRETVLDALVAKDMAAGLDNRILEFALANLALEHTLRIGSVKHSLMH